MVSVLQYLDVRFEDGEHDNANARLPSSPSFRAAADQSYRALISEVLPLAVPWRVSRAKWPGQSLGLPLSARQEPA